MKTFEILIQMMFICNKMTPEKVIRIVLHPDFSGHMSYEYMTDYEKGEKRLFSWGEGYGNLLVSFVDWLAKQK